MVKYVGMPDTDLDEADEFKTEAPVTMAKSQGKQRDSERQARVIQYLSEQGPAGATAKETTDHLIKNFDSAEYHGPVSGALSSLKKAGRVKMLRRGKRGGFHVYVLNEHVGDREVKEDAVFGLKKAPESTGEVESLKAEVANLQHVIEDERAKRHDAEERVNERNVQVDNALQEIDRLKRENERRNADLDAVVESNRVYGVRLQQEGDRADAVESSLQTATQEVRRLQEQVTDYEAELAKPAPAARPRKVLTEDEQKTLAGVAKALREKYTSDGTPDNPARITVKVSTLRILGRALQRVTSD